MPSILDLAEPLLWCAWALFRRVAETVIVVGEGFVEAFKEMEGEA